MSKEKEVTDNTIMWFGSFKGRYLKDVPAWYLLGIKNPELKLKKYIEENKEVLEKERYEQD